MDIDLKKIAYIPTTGVRRVHETPLVAANDASLNGYGCLVETPTIQSRSKRTLVSGS